MTDFHSQLNEVLKYGIIPESDLKALATEAKRADREEDEAGRNPGPNSAAGVLADLLEEHGDPRALIVRRSQDRRQRAMEQDTHPVSLIGHDLLAHIGGSSENEDYWGTLDGSEPQEEHHYPDGSLLRTKLYVHEPTGKRVHWAYWDVPAHSPDSEPFPQFHHFGAPLTDEELAQVKAEE